MTTSVSPATGVGGRLLVPVLIALELFGGIIQGWIIPLVGGIAAHYEVSGGSVSWVLTVSLLSSAVSVPLFVVIADRYGRKRILVLAVALTAAGSVLIALAPTFPLLLLGAIIQGPVAVWLPIEMALLKTLRPAAANRVIGYLVGTLTIGVALGAVLGGVAMDAIGHLPTVQLLPALGIVALVAATLAFVPADRGDARRSVDVAGAIVLGVALVGVMFGLSEGTAAGWTSPLTLGPLAIGALALVGFVFVEMRARTPLIDVGVIRGGGLITPLVIAFLVSIALFGNQTPSVLYLTASPDAVGYGAGVSAGAVGAVIGLTALVSSVAAFLSNALARRLGERTTVALGALIAAGGFAALATLPQGLALLLVFSAIASAGTGLVTGVLPGIVVQRAPESSAASVSGLYNTTRTLAGSLAGAFVAATLATLVIGDPSAAAPAVPAAAAFQVIWAVFAVGNVVGAVLALTLRRAPRPASASVPTPQEVAA
ncbi:MFS transporter [Microbacterium sp. W1N]|uniref:MFS transporter n=1 Tax=Microbacterium festucae TaxID=2977531 RepID=UPI0021BE1852|nr:MFS transporter [Microbacterium festucae]MCT9819566.1 MFS transporter [Microbacterium festucae]